MTTKTNIHPTTSTRREKKIPTKLTQTTGLLYGTQEWDGSCMAFARKQDAERRQRNLNLWSGRHDPIVTIDLKKHSKNTSTTLNTT